MDHNMTKQPYIQARWKYYNLHHLVGYRNNHTFVGCIAIYHMHHEILIYATRLLHNYSSFGEVI